MLAGFSQLSGITPLFSFLPEIFRSAGTATGDAFFQSVLVSLVNLVFTLCALAGGYFRTEEADTRRHSPAIDFVCVGGLVLSHPRQRVSCADFCDDVCRRSRFRKRRRLLGDHLGNLSHKSPWSRHVHCDDCVVGGRISWQPELPLDAETSGKRWHVLDFQQRRHF